MKVKKDTAPQKTNLRKVKKHETSKLKADANFEKAVKNVQQIFKERKAEAKAVKRKINSIKHKQRSRKKITRGIVYVGHIPHGFYEQQMEDYFQQFGKVTRVRVSRSRKTGRSRGYGYIEFIDTDVAKIAAETMHNYLMCGRLLKATYIPPEEQHKGFFLGKNWTEEIYPKLKKRQKMIQQKNASQSSKHYMNYVQKSLSKLSKLEKTLDQKGIDIKFQPVNVPECD